MAWAPTQLRTLRQILAELYPTDAQRAALGCRRSCVRAPLTLGSYELREKLSTAPAFSGISNATRL
jgi:hypothetical protein